MSIFSFQLVQCRFTRQNLQSLNTTALQIFLAGEENFNVDFLAFSTRGPPLETPPLAVERIPVEGSGKQEIIK